MRNFSALKSRIHSYGTLFLVLFERRGWQARTSEDSSKSIHVPYRCSAGSSTVVAADRNRAQCPSPVHNFIYYIYELLPQSFFFYFHFYVGEERTLRTNEVCGSDCVEIPRQNHGELDGGKNTGFVSSLPSRKGRVYWQGTPSVLRALCLDSAEGVFVTEIIRSF